MGNLPRELIAQAQRRPWDASEGHMRQAIVMVKKNVSAAEARRLLDQHRGNCVRCSRVEPHRAPSTVIGNRTIA